MDDFKSSFKLLKQEKNYEILHTIQQFVIYRHKNNFISFSYNQLADYIKKYTKHKVTPKYIGKYIDVLQDLSFITLIAKPHKSKRKACIGKAKSFYLVTDFIEEDGMFEENWEPVYNSKEKAMKLKSFDYTDYTIRGKLSFEEFFSYFQFNYFRTPALLEFVKRIMNTLYAINNNNYIEYKYYIVYPSMFLESYKCIFKYLFRDGFKYDLVT